MFHYSSLLIPLLVLLPNMLFLVYPPNGAPKGVASGGKLSLAAEGVGRFGVIATPLFYPIAIDQPGKLIGLLCALIFLCLYWYCWIRYFINHREVDVLYKPIFKLPVPMAWSPVMYFVSASLLLHSLYLLLFSILLAAGHIPMSLREANKDIR